MLTYADLFSGTGEFRRGMDAAGLKCVYAHEMYQELREQYVKRFGEKPTIADDALPSYKHDILTCNLWSGNIGCICAFMDSIWFWKPEAFILAADLSKEKHLGLLLKTEYRMHFWDVSWEGVIRYFIGFKDKNIDLPIEVRDSVPRYDLSPYLPAVMIREMGEIVKDAIILKYKKALLKEEKC